MSLYSVETHGQLQPYLSREWLLTNGIGAFASSTVVGCNTRRYHGLLIAATNPPVGRIAALSRIGELVYLQGKSEPLELSISQFGQRFHPHGERYLQRFELNDTARWEFHVEQAVIVKEVSLERGRNAVSVRYTVRSPRPLELHLLPFVNLRDFHSLLVGAGHHFDVERGEARMTVTRQTQRLHLRADGCEVRAAADWWRGHTYAIETQRGQDDTEDLYVPGRFVARIDGETTITLHAAVNEGSPTEPPVSTVTVLHPQRVNDAPSLTLRRFFHAADAFIVRRTFPDGSKGATIIAGYPWFSDWGRDTMIALPGLLLSTGRFEEAGGVLRIFAHYVSQGMIPNVFDDYTNQPHYNTVDASLWFIHAAYEYLRASGDQRTFAEHLLPACRQILDGYRNGTRYGIAMDPADGLLRAGDASTQLTWMDAKCDGVVFTPRHGKAVEINALWYHALCLLGENELAERVQRSFRREFWINPFRGLYDCVDGQRRDRAVRPNQIFAVSLPNSPLDRDQQRAVVEIVRRELLTPMGLRSLARGEMSYQGQYLGPRRQRDAAYHNGTVWAWLIGPFLDAYLRVNENSPEAIAQARDWLQPLIDNLDEACLGQIAEIYDGDPPHAPRGAFAQAWSVAEVLRLAARLGF